MQPLTRTDDRITLELTVTTEWGGTGGEPLWDAFSDVVPDPSKRHVKERKPNSSLYNMKQDGYSEVDVLDGLTWSGVDGPLPEGWIARDEIGFVLRDVDGVQAAYEQLEAWFDAARDGEDGLSPLVERPPLKAFQARHVTFHTEDGWVVDTDPVKCERESRGRCLVDIDRWTLAYEGEEQPDSSWEVGEPARVYFTHSDAYTVVLATEAADVLDSFLEENRMLIAAEGEEEVDGEF